jgi:23S rRNA (uracil747-C5)-methyltransferase
MDCGYFRDNVCRSCSLLGRAYADTLVAKEQRLRELFPDVALLPTYACPDARGSRIRARLAVTGSLDSPRLGFLDAGRQLVPVDQCPLHHPQINVFALRLAELIQDARLTPFDPETNRGELKFVVLTCSPAVEPQDSRLMVQFVLRSREAVERARSLWRRLQNEADRVVDVLSINLQPVRSSLINGPEELAVSDQTWLPIRFLNRELLFGPQSFVQTNHHVASALYESAVDVLRTLGTHRLLDLYCGAGAFGLLAADCVESVTGVDSSPDAIQAARESARRNGLTRVRFEERDLTGAVELAASTGGFDTVLCNPPRRGLDPAAVEAIRVIQPEHVVYSSCHPDSLARDLASLNADFKLIRLQAFDMFPFTAHCEVLAVLSRRTTP